MTPEELVATREDANVDYAPEITYDDWQAMARALLTHIDSQAAQIEALKEKLVEEVAWSHFNEERLGARQDVSFSDVAEEYRRKARQQLAEEMPEVDWQ